VIALAHAGADVALGCATRQPAPTSPTGSGAWAAALRLPMDVRDLDQVRPAVDSTVGQLGRLDILVNNARLGPANPAEEVTEVDFDLTRGVNVKGTFFASQAAGRVSSRASAASLTSARRRGLSCLARISADIIERTC
jgi:NAD(P)-dependent dehydrogenase (short-subunit alcohol dehydrogenase family)